MDTWWRLHAWLGFGGPGSSPESAAKLADSFLKQLGLGTGSAARARELPWQELIAAQSALPGGVAGARLGPVIDGRHLPLSPYQAVQHGQVSDKPLLLGSNRDEVKLFNVGGGERRPIADRDFPKLMRATLPGASDEQIQALIDTYRQSRRALNLPNANPDILDAITSDLRFRLPAMNLALAQGAAGGNAYLYLFDWESPARGGRLGACHALEMPFVFGTLHAPTQDRFAGKGPDAEQLSAQMMDAWIAFARNGDPSHGDIGPWPLYDGEQRLTMRFGRQSGVAVDPLVDERRALSRLLQPA